MALNTQRALYWLEQGKGKTIIITIAFLLFILVFSCYYSYKRFGGPRTENTIEQALIGKMLSQGKGYSTPALFPQLYKYMKENHGYEAASGDPLPDLYHPPGYPTLIAAGLKTIGKENADKLWKPGKAVTKYERVAFNGDYYLLAVNLILFWIACLLTYLLGRWLFSPQAGLISLLGLILSVGVWDQILSLSGSSLLMVLVLASFILWQFLDKCRGEDPEQPEKKYYPALSVGIGLLCGLMYLTEYTAGLLLVIFIAYCLIVFRGKARWICPVSATVVFFLTILPWSLRNIELTGNPVALAAENLPLKKGDPTAEPEMVKFTFSAETPTLSVKKVIGKGLKGLEHNMTKHIWSSGSYIFSGFFLVGCLYTFRRKHVNSLRWVAVGSTLFLLAAQPFFNSGISERLPAYYFSPIIIVFGTGFFLVLLESTKDRTQMQKLIASACLIAIQALPLAHNFSKPQMIHFSYPPYYPTVLNLVNQYYEKNIKSNFGLMSDIPAGLAWYGDGKQVWGQPKKYSEFAILNTSQYIGALYLSPKLLDQPYFTELVRAELDSGDIFKKKHNWSAIYANLHSGKFPAFFPLQSRQQLVSNMYLLVNQLAIELENSPSG